MSYIEFMNIHVGRSLPPKPIMNIIGMKTIMSEVSITDSIVSIISASYADSYR